MLGYLGGLSIYLNLCDRMRLGFAGAFDPAAFARIFVLIKRGCGFLFAVFQSGSYNGLVELL